MGGWTSRRYRLLAAVIVAGVLFPAGLAATYASTNRAADAAQSAAAQEKAIDGDPSPNGQPESQSPDSTDAPDDSPDASSPNAPDQPGASSPNAPIAPNAPGQPGAATAAPGPTEESAPAAEAPAPAGPGGTTVTPTVTRLSLGSFAQPAPGVTVSDGPAEGAPPTRSHSRHRGQPRTMSLVRASTAPFRAAGVTWQANPHLGGVSVSLRAHRVGADWGSWQTAAVTDGDRDVDPKAPLAVRDGADLVWVGPSDGVEVAVTSTYGPPPVDVTLDLIDPMDAPADATAGAPAGAVPASGLPATLAAPRPAPVILRRSAWGADERLMTWRPQYAPAVKAVVLHDTGTGDDYAPADVPKIIRALYQYQAVSRGWGDLGYNVLVDRFGRLWEGRSGGLSRPVVGAQAGGFNTGTTGVAMIGDYATAAVPPPVVESTARYVAWKFSLGPAIDPRGTVKLTGGGPTARYPAGSTITVPRVYPHRQTSDTDCPGAKGINALQPVRDRAAALLAGLTRSGTVRARLATWQPADARWRVRGTSQPVWTGVPGDVPVPADYDGDGATDFATWTPSTGTWQVAASGGDPAAVPGTAAAAPGDGTNGMRRFTLGSAGDRPMAADFDGDGRAEPATFTPSTGAWHFANGSTVIWGRPGDVPVPADYTGDGRVDIAVYRPGNGTWYIRGMRAIRLGRPWHIPVPADYDGDGVAEPATWSTTTHRWFVRGRAPVEFGAKGDVPVPWSYNGDGRADFAVLHTVRDGHGGATVVWQIRGVGSYTFGSVGDVATPLN